MLKPQPVITRGGVRAGLKPLRNLPLREDVILDWALSTSGKNPGAECRNGREEVFRHFDFSQKAEKLYVSILAKRSRISVVSSSAMRTSSFLFGKGGRGKGGRRKGKN